MLTSPTRPTPAAQPTNRAASADRHRSNAPSGTQGIGHRKPASTRSAVEWVTLAISSLIVGGLIVLTTYFYVTDSDAPASIAAEPRLAETFQQGTRYAVPVVVRNMGGATAEDVTVRVTLTSPDGRTETAEWQVQFLSGGGTSRGVAVFGDDPRSGQLEAGVVSYLEP